MLPDGPPSSAVVCGCQWAVIAPHPVTPVDRKLPFHVPPPSPARAFPPPLTAADRRVRTDPHVTPVTPPAAAEVLENRRLLTVFRVHTAAVVFDANDGRLSLREALTAANTDAAFSDAPAGDGQGDVVALDPALGGRDVDLTAPLEITDDVVLLARDAHLVGGASEGSVIDVELNRAQQVVIDSAVVRGGRLADVQGEARDGAGIDFRVRNPNAPPGPAGRSPAGQPD